jgi:hypothetical protein
MIFSAKAGVAFMGGKRSKELDMQSLKADTVKPLGIAFLWVQTAENMSGR